MLNVRALNKILTRLITGVLAIAILLWPTTSLADNNPISKGVFTKGDSQREVVVTLANQFTVTKAQLPDFLERWGEIGAYMKQKPGFVSAELQKDILNDQEWTMSEQWKSLADYRRAVSTDEFQALLKDFPAKANWLAQDLFPSTR